MTKDRKFEMRNEHAHAKILKSFSILHRVGIIFLNQLAHPGVGKVTTHTHKNQLEIG